jgi:hypothetical protein
MHVQVAMLKNIKHTQLGVKGIFKTLVLLWQLMPFYDKGKDHSITPIGDAK